MLMLSMVSALSAQANVIVATVFDADVVKGQQSSFGMVITNNNSYGIYKVSISDVQDYSFPNVEEITAFTSYNTAYNLTSSFIGDKTSSAALSWSNKTQGVATPAITEVILGSSYIIPNNISVRKLDTVQWRNNHSSNLTVRASDGEYEMSISPSQTASRVFASEGSKGFYVVENGYVGNMTVTSNIVDIFVHDSSKDILLSFSVSSVLSPVTLAALPLITNFSMQHNETIEGVLMLTSSGFVSNAVLEGSKWLVFPTNNVSFGNQKLVNFRIEPIVNQTSATGIIHNISIRVRTENTPDAFANISVFVGFHNFTIAETIVNKTQVVLATREQLVALCRQYPEECPTQNITQLVFINRTDTEEAVTLRQIREELERVKNLQREQASPVIELSTKIDTLASELSGVRHGISGLQVQKVEEKKKSLVKTIILVVLGFFGSLATAITVFSVVVRKRMIQRRIA